MEIKNNKFLVLVGVFVLGFVFSSVLFGKLKQGVSFGGVADDYRFLTVATSSQMAVTTTSSLILATSTNMDRRYVALVNYGANVVYLGFNGAPAVVGSGISLNASGGSYEIIPGQNLYMGAISAISSGGNSSLSVVEK